MHNIAIAMFRDEAARNEVLAASPLRVDLDQPTMPHARSTASSLSTLSSQAHITASPSNWNHRAHIERCRYYAGFDPDLTSATAQDLRLQSVPNGLMDWGKSDEPSRIRNKRRERLESLGQPLSSFWGKSSSDSDGQQGD